MKQSTNMGVAGELQRPAMQLARVSVALAKRVMFCTPAIVFISTLGLSACTAPKPVSVEEAMAECTYRARSAVKPDVRVGVGVGTGGYYGNRVHGGIGIEMSGDYLKGRSPHEVYETCVVDRSGEKPTQPLKL